MSYNDVAVDLMKSFELMKSVNHVIAESDVEYSLKHAAVLCEASKHLREVSAKNRRLAQEIRELSKNSTLRA